MKPGTCLASLIVIGCFTPPVLAEPALRGMATGEDFRVGPVLSGGVPFGLAEPGDRQFYSLSFQGESPNHGFSRIFFRMISLYELLDLPALSSATAAEVRFHHQFASFGLESPLFYELTGPNNWEFGWSAAFNLARVTFKQKTKSDPTGLASLFTDYPELKPTELQAQSKTNAGQADAQFLGGELGGYVRYYQLYPFVPYLSARINLGSYFDAPAMIQGIAPTSTTGQNSTTSTTTSTTRVRSYQSAFRWAPVFSAGLDFYIAGRGVLGAEINFWNWDWMNRPTDNTLFVNLKAGFLF